MKVKRMAKTKEVLREAGTQTLEVTMTSISNLIIITIIILIIVIRMQI